MNYKNPYSYILLILCILPWDATAQYSRQMFGKLSIEDGLSQSVVNAIIQDKYGFMWFGTNDGLNKYDGYSFKIYRKKDGLSDGAIKCLLTVNDTLLWVGTKYSGIDILNLKTNKFIRHINTANSGLNSNAISSMQLDANNQVWIASDNGLNIVLDSYEVTSVFKNPGNKKEFINTFIIINPDEIWICKEYSGIYKYSNNTLIQYPVRYTDPEYKSNDNIIIAHDNTMWLSTNVGLYFMEKGASSFSNKDLKRPELKGNQVNHLFLDKSGNIWFNMHSHGLFRLDANDELISYSEKSLYSSNLDLIGSVCSYIDRSGMIWIGTNGYGIQYFYPEPNFNTLSYDINSSFHTSSRSIRKITNHLTDSNKLWIGGYSGLDLFDKKQGLVRNYNTKNSFSRGFTGDAIYDIYHDKSGLVLLGSEGRGLVVFDPRKEEFSIKKPKVPGKNFVIAFKIYKDSEGQIWVGTNNGLYSYSIENQIITPVYNSLQEVQRFNIYDIYELNSLILLATNKGLFVYDKNSKLCRNVSLNLKGISEPHINSFLVENDLISFCTSGNGFLRYKYRVINSTLLNLDLVAMYTSNNGLPNDVIYGVCKDESGRYWMSSNKGLISIDRAGTIDTYNYTDGLQGNEFNNNSYFKDADGTLYFGGINGLSYFKPALLHKNYTVPLISFTSFKVFNNPVDSDYNLNEISELEIPYSDNVLTFSFSSSEYASNKKLNYAYKLEGFNDHFIDLGTVNNVTFTNLDPGEYVLHVIGTNSDGIWNREGRRLKIQIVPPYWKTVWFLGYCILLGAGLIYLFVRMRLKNIAFANLRLEREVHKRTVELSEKNKELAIARDVAEQSDKAKSEFLATMSHEIRTPMNGVVGMVSLLEKASLNPVQKNYVEIIRTSTDNLLQVINDILDFSKIDSGKFDLFIESVNIHKLLETTINLFMPKACEKNIELIMHVSPAVPDVILTDETRLNQILFNLLNNALKFTASGHIYIQVDCRKTQGSKVELDFKVTDTGIGIPPEKQNHIFQLFTQADSSTSRKFGGTGLGLTICKRLVELMNGTISVTSEPGKGSEFHFTIEADSVYSSEKYIPRPLFSKAVLAFQNTLNQTTCTAYLSELNLESVEYANNPDELFMHNDNLVFITDDEQVAQQLAAYSDRYEFRLVFLYAQKHEGVRADQFITKPITKDKLAKIVSETHVIARQDKPGTPQTLLSQKYPLNILVAEDHSINQVIFKKMFQSLGYSIVMVENGEQALKEAVTNRYDLLFMDIHMPEMDGMQATRKVIAELGSEAPVIIALTASVINNEIHEYKEAGMQDVLAKPLALDSLRNCITKWAEERLSKK